MADLAISAAKVTAQDFGQAKDRLAIQNLRGGAQSNEKAKIEKSARDFESILIGQWLEQAEKSFATVPGEDPDKKDQDVGQDQFRSIAFRSLAEGLTKAGGFGIASMISKRLEAAEARQSAPSPDGFKAGKSHNLK